MVKFVCLLFFTVLVVTINAQTPGKCMTPEQWSAFRSRHDPATHTAIYERYYYDQRNMRKRHDEERFQGMARTKHQIFNFYNEMKEYSFDPVTRACNVSELTHPFRVYGVQPNDTFVGEYEIGAPIHGLLVMAWAGDRTEGMFQGRYVSVWTRRDCLPVSETYFNQQGPPEHENYYNVTLGFQIDTFNLPPECGKLSV